jgi:hypothetical protein
LRLRESGVGHWALTVALLVVAAGCGKKGPPLTPIVRMPVAVATLTPKRVGTEVYVTFTVPAQNIDTSKPASISRVELYAATSLTVPPRARFLEIATRVGSIPVAPAADPADPGAEMPPYDPKVGALQGAAVTVRDQLTDEALQPRELTVLAEERRAVPAGITVVAAPRVLRRFYVAIPFNHAGQAGPPSAIVELPLTPLPDPPTGLVVTQTPLAAALAWDASGGLIGWLMNRATPLELSPLGEPPIVATVAPVTADLPPGPTSYNVYRELAPDPLVLPDPRTAVMPWNAPPPVPLNPAPLAVLTFADPLTYDERERCYTVRAVRGTIESVPSSRECIAAVDIYPPAPPSQLRAIAGDGFINVTWAPNDEPDLGGYIVLRAAAGDATLLQLTPTPLPDTRYSDRAVTPGVRYTYVVRAVDSRVPAPNLSDPAEVSETAR